MKRIIALLTFIAVLSGTAKGQINNSIEFGINRCLFTTGDVDGWQISNKVNFGVSAKFDIHCGINFAFGSSDPIGTSFGPDDPEIGNLTIIGKEGFYPFDDGRIPGERYDQGISILQTNTENHMYLNIFSGIGFKVINRKKSTLNLSGGAFIGYVKRGFIAMLVDCDFDSSQLGQDIEVTLAVPFYLRKYDGGYFVGAVYHYSISETISLGLNLEMMKYLSSDNILSFGVTINHKL